MPHVEVFDKFAKEYDQWFETHAFAYQSEVEAVKRFIPSEGIGIEIGVGTGRFSVPFNITVGVEPSEQMAAIAHSRGITVHISRAEQLPFDSEQFDFALMVTTLCFVDNPKLILKEAGRILKPGGKIVVAIIDKESSLGRTYEAMKASNKFYSRAKFYSTKEVIELLHHAHFNQIQTCQTIFSNPDTMTMPDTVKDGYGEGAFVVISAIKSAYRQSLLHNAASWQSYCDL